MAKNKMMAQVFYEPRKMVYEEVDIPEIADDEVLIRVKACGICGSDIAYYFGDSPLETATGKGPLILGHEFTGQVVEAGQVAETLFQKGDRVVLDPLQYCYSCDICSKGQINLCENKAVLGVSVNGGFAEYAKSKMTSTVKLPKNVSYGDGALTEPLACAFYAVKNLQIEPGMFCVIIGPGPIGLMMTQLVKSSGAGTLVLVGTRDYRLKLGKKLGADIVLNTKDKKSPYYCRNLKKEIEKLTDGMFADRCITSTGSVKAMEAALDITGRRSVVVYFGLPGAKDYVRVPALQSIFWDKTIRFSWLAPLTWPSSLQALSTKLIDVHSLATHTYDLKDVVKGLTEVKARKGNPLKALVKP
ncbi:MAG: alcohol dehydrogenase catalytic domain-containing protein [Planctomycetes bacterium]|nr:alcohol dehydrogenase catalytic domain-containing protein [Planctomycetota bacterium]